MPSFPITDSHVHYWDTGHLRYPWLERHPTLGRPFLLDDYRAACGPVEVERIVFVQAEVEPGQHHAEAKWVTSLARQDPRIQGIVAWAPLEEGNAVRAELESLAANPLVKGIRRIIQSEEDDQFAVRPGFVAGVRALADHRLRFDLCCGTRHLAAGIELARRCADVPIVLDHIATPRIAEGEWEPWASQLRALAELPNTWCKVSGLVTVADRAAWTREDLVPYVHHVIDCFGFDRVMYGSDWPVSTQAAAYPQWVEALDWAVRDATDVQRRALFGANGDAFYGLV